LVRIAQEHHLLNEYIFRTYLACSGNLEVLGCALKENRTEEEDGLLVTALWDEEDDEIVLIGSKRDRWIVEQRRGKGSVEFRREFLERLGKSSREHW